MSRSNPPHYKRLHLCHPKRHTTISIRPNHLRVWLKQMPLAELRNLYRETAYELIDAGDYEGTLSRAVRDRVDEILAERRYAA